MTTPLVGATTASGAIAIQHLAGVDAAPMRDEAPTLEILGATVRGARGAVFGPLDATSRAPITIVLGNRGSGRTSLLLSAAGRMRIDQGTVKVCGVDARTHAGRLRHLTGIAGFDAIDLLEAGATVGESIRERLTWISPWYRRVPRLTQDDVSRVLGPVFGLLPQPGVRLLVRDLSEAQELLVRISLALLEGPRVVVVDDLDDVKDPSERAAVADRITALARDGVLFILGSADERDLNLFSPESLAVVALDR
jgi:ABC-type multidrug transport system ATPase subunit